MASGASASSVTRASSVDGDSISRGGDSISRGGDSISRGEDAISRGGDAISSTRASSVTLAAAAPAAPLLAAVRTATAARASACEAALLAAASLASAAAAAAARADRPASRASSIVLYSALHSWQSPRPSSPRREDLDPRVLCTSPIGAEAGRGEVTHGSTADRAAWSARTPSAAAIEAGASQHAPPRRSRQCLRRRLPLH